MQNAMKRKIFTVFLFLFFRLFFGTAFADGDVKKTTAVKCEPIKDIIKGSAICTVDNRQTFSCIIECDPGYAVRRGEPWPAIDPVCYQNDKGVYVWEKYYKECFLTPCKKPDLKLPLDGVCTDFYCHLWCATGYQLVGKNKMTCFNEVWSEKMPICKNPAKFPIAPKPCEKRTTQYIMCRLSLGSLAKKPEILKRLDIKCYNWIELFNQHKDYLKIQYKLSDKVISNMKRNLRTMDCAILTNIVEQFDGKSNCDELCKRAFQYAPRQTPKIPIGGYNVGNLNDTRTCMCVTKHFYNEAFYI